MVHYAIISSVKLGKMQRSQGNCFLSPLFQWAGADVPSIERTLALPQRAGAAVALVRSFTAGAHEMSIPYTEARGGNLSSNSDPCTAVWNQQDEAKPRLLRWTTYIT